MQTLFSTGGVHPKNAFRRWGEMVCERLVPADLRTFDDVPFQGRMDVTGIGPLLVSHFSHTAKRTEATAETVRRNGRHDRVYAVLRLSGQDTIQQGDQEAVSRAGDFVVVDARPAVFQTETGSALVLDLPRDRLETALGPSRLFSALRVGGTSPPRSWRGRTSRN